MMNRNSNLNKELEQLLAIFESPRVAIQNSCDGPVTVTCSCEDLPKHYVTENALIRLILTAVQGHVTQYKDSGHFLGLVIIKILRSYLDNHYHPKLFSNVLTWCSKQSQLSLNNLNYKFEVTADSIPSVLYSTLSSNLSMIVYDYELKALTKQLAEIFIMTEGNSSHPVQYLKCRDTKHSTQLHKGVMIDRHHSNTLIPSGTYTAVLIEFSMSGDLGEIDDVTYTGDSVSAVSEGVMVRLQSMISSLSDSGVNLIISQRVIHPKIKILLSDRGMIYMERLGLDIQRLSILSGCLPYKSLTDSSTDIKVCTLSCSHINQNKETWLLLDCAALPLYCLMISTWSDKIASEIQSTCMQALHVLRLTLHDTRLLQPNWLSQLVLSIQAATEGMKAEEMRKIGATPTVFRCIMGYFLKAIRSSYRDTDDENRHTVSALWTSYYSAITTAVSISNAVMMTGQSLQTV